MTSQNRVGLCLSFWLRGPRYMQTTLIFSHIEALLVKKHRVRSYNGRRSSTPELDELDGEYHMTLSLWWWICVIYVLSTKTSYSMNKIAAFVYKCPKVDQTSWSQYSTHSLDEVRMWYFSIKTVQEWIEWTSVFGWWWIGVVCRIKERYFCSKT